MKERGSVAFPNRGFRLLSDCKGTRGREHGFDTGRERGVGEFTSPQGGVPTEPKIESIMIGSVVCERGVA
jgi:hypothetical protein